MVSYDMESSEFKRIAAKSNEPESHCQYGPSFLVYERSTGRFLEFFCGNKSNRIEAKKLFPFLPLTQADIDAKAAASNDVSDLRPRPASRHPEGKAGREQTRLVARSGGGEVLYALHEAAEHGRDRP